MYAGDEIYDTAELEEPSPLDADYRCRFCHRYVIDGLYVRVSFPDGVANVCDNCMEKRDEPEPDVVGWRGTEVEVVG